MSIRDWFKRARVIGSSNPQNPAYWVQKFFGGGQSTSAGVQVDESTALKFSPVWAAVNIISGAVGFLPLPVYQRTDKGKEKVHAHPVYRLLHDRPNPLITAQVFREALQAHLLTWGNAYAEIERNGAGRPIALWPITPDRVLPDQDRLKDGVLVWKVSHSTKPDVFIPDENMLHIPGLGFDGIVGYSVIQHASESIGLGMGAETFGSTFFGNGATVGNVLEHPGKLSEDARKNLAKSIKDKYSGPQNAHRTLILEEDMKWKPLGFTQKDSQFLETRKFQINDIARWFQIPPHMIGDLERATFDNIEHQGIEFVTWTLARWLKRWESECNYKLFSQSDQQTHFAEFLVDALLRGDTKTRYESYGIAVEKGWMNRNEVRERENMNRQEGLDKFLTPMNMAGGDNNQEGDE